MNRRGSEYGLRGSLRQALKLAPPRGMLYRDAHYFTATVEVDVPTMQSWLPSGVRAVTPGRADVFTAWFPDCTYGSV
ncbi:hypothetical protein TPAU25S_03287 [Tsukamurella paurometabola]|uniref:hypothetical protein n=1 Tax=Tsukamurella paurometabola TaxID=2061 RepID=UPI00019F0EE9|nr:hypothetical protein [Tsukamurella paurometabola]SUP43195.1 Uncharacterised protein [Tsukamurella paurometabola]